MFLLSSGNLESEVERLQEQLTAVQSEEHDTENLRAKIGSLLQRTKSLEGELSAVRFEEQVYDGAGISKRVAVGALEVM